MRAYADWGELASSIRESMSPLRYELVTLAAAPLHRARAAGLTDGEIVAVVLTVGRPSGVLP